MPDSPDFPDPLRSLDDATDPAPPAGAPRWVKVIGIAALLLVILLGVMLLAGHRPGRHMASGGPAGPSAVTALSPAPARTP